MVSRTYSAPNPFGHSQFFLQQVPRESSNTNSSNSNSSCDNDNNSSFRKLEVCSKQPMTVQRTKSYTMTNMRNDNSNEIMRKTMPAPTLRNNARLYKQPVKLQQQQPVPVVKQPAPAPAPKRRKPRVQSGPAVTAVTTRAAFHRLTTRNANFPKLIRDTSFRVIREKELERKWMSVKEPQQQQLPKRRKPRLQSGAALKDIHSSSEFKQYTAKNGVFPTLIRDLSFRRIRRTNLERNLNELPHYKATAKNANTATATSCRNVLL